MCVMTSPLFETLYSVASAGLPASFVTPLPSPEGFALKDLRRGCAEYGSARFTPYSKNGKLAGLSCVVEPRTEPLIALAMIARDDVVGLERAIISCIDQVDEIVIAVDGRSDHATLKVAQAYADTCVTFAADDLGLSEEEWKADKIHFANARNFGRRLVKAPWCLVIDSDEVFSTNEDLRLRLGAVGHAVGAWRLAMGAPEMEQRDAQRLARTRFRYFSSSHNQLPIWGMIRDIDCFVAHDVSLRPHAEMVRRVKQRNAGIEDLVEEGKKGDISALFHAAKHLIGVADERAIELTSEYRLRTEIHGPQRPERAWLAIGVAAMLCTQERLRDAEVWALRSLLDGPRVEAFCFLGDIAMRENAFRRALGWYECACATEPTVDKLEIPIHGGLDYRFAQRDACRKIVAEKNL